MTLSVAAVLAESAARRPDHPAVVSAAGSFSYQQLWRRARQYAAVLTELDIHPHDRVALLLGNEPEFPMAYFGILAVGAVVVPVNSMLRAHEIEYVLRDAECVALVCGGPQTEQGGPAAERAGVRLLTIGAAQAPAQSRLDLLAQDTVPVDGYRPRQPDDLALVMYTSGTTGKPKGAMLTHLNVTMNVAVGMISPFDFKADDRLLGCLPLFHTFGQICGMTTCFRAGATLVLMSRFDATTAIETMATQRCTVMMGVPTMYLALLDVIDQAPAKPSLDRAYSGGSALAVAVLDRFETAFSCRIYEGYGLTETSPSVSYNQKDWPCRPGTVGRPLWGVEVEIARADREDQVELLPAGEIGEIVVRGHNVMTGYLNQPEATAAVLQGGWFRSGDLGTKDGEGYLTVVDRKKDMLVRNGYNVYPREIEEVLMRHPAIAAVAVIGLPHHRHGEEICAVVQARAGAQPGSALAAQIVIWSREWLAAYKYPRLVEFVEEFPLGPSGKILKRELIARLKDPTAPPAAAGGS